MVRVMFVRHGFTNSNERDARMAIKMAKGEVPAAEAYQRIQQQAREAGATEAEGDTSLSTYNGGGVVEAERLGAYWGSILKGKAEAGQLHTFVSAMQR